MPQLGQSVLFLHFSFFFNPFFFSTILFLFFPILFFPNIFFSKSFSLHFISFFFLHQCSINVVPGGTDNMRHNAKVAESLQRNLRNPVFELSTGPAMILGGPPHCSGCQRSRRNEAGICRGRPCSSKETGSDVRDSRRREQEAQ